MCGSPPRCQFLIHCRPLKSGYGGVADGETAESGNGYLGRRQLPQRGVCHRSMRFERHQLIQCCLKIGVKNGVGAQLAHVVTHIIENHVVIAV